MHYITTNVQIGVLHELLARQTHTSDRLPASVLADLAADGVKARTSRSTHDRAAYHNRDNVGSV
jgi:hypothetical protein